MSKFDYKNKVSDVKNLLNKSKIYHDVDKLRYFLLLSQKKWEEIDLLTYSSCEKAFNNGKIEECLNDWYSSNHNGRKLNLQNPKTYSEKMQWLKLYDTTPLKTQLTDKYEVKKWVADKIGEEYLVNTIQACDSSDDLKFDTFPNHYVIKPNNWSQVTANCFGEVYVQYLRNMQIDYTREQIIEKINWCLNHKFTFMNGFEMQYLNIKPKILVEEYALDDCEEKSTRTQIFDYYCFNGKPMYTSAYYTDSPWSLLYSKDWTRQEFGFNFTNLDRPLDKAPAQHEQMWELAQKLCKDFCFCRVDFRIHKGKPIFEEMTFTPNSGVFYMNNEYFDNMLGEMIELPKEKKPIPKLELS